MLVKIVKTTAVNIAKNILIMVDNPLQMRLKLLLKKQFKKQQKQLVLWSVIKLLIKLQKCQEIPHRIAQKQSQKKQKILDLIEKYLKKDISPEKM